MPTPNVTGFAVFTSQIGVATTAATAVSASSNGVIDKTATVIGVGSTAQSLFSLGTIGSTTNFALKTIPGVGVGLSGFSAGITANKISVAINNNQPIDQADVASLVSAVAGGVGSALVLFSAGAVFIVPLVVVAIGAGGYQLVAQSKGWKIDAFTTQPTLANIPFDLQNVATSLDTVDVTAAAFPGQQQREVFINAGLSPEGTALGQVYNLSGSQNIWVRDTQTGGFINVISENSITSELRYDSTGFLSSITEYKPDGLGNILRQDEIYTPDGAYTTVPSLLISDPNASNGNYTIQAGDTLWGLSTLNGLSLDELLDANPEISQPGAVKIGQVINIPATPATTSTIDISTNTSSSTISSKGTANETAAANNVTNGLAIASGTHSVQFTNDTLVSTDFFKVATGFTSTNDLRPGNFSNYNFNVTLSPNGNLTPVPSFMGVYTGEFTSINDYGKPLAFLTPDAQLAYAPNFSVSNNASSTFQNSLTFVDPLILDLNNDGIQLNSYAQAGVLFDIDHDGGSQEQTGWVKADTTTGQAYNMDGILVHDLNNNDRIDGIHETLSEYYTGIAGTNGADGTKPFTNGFSALKSLDSNNDNQFTDADAAWNTLKVWVDANADGITDAGDPATGAGKELFTLDELDITSIDLNATNQSGLINNGNEVRATGNFTINGQEQTAQAIDFIANPAGSTFTTDANGITISTDKADGTQQKGYTLTNTQGSILSTASLNVSNLYGNDGDDTLNGDATANWLSGGRGADTFNAGAGDDVLLIDSKDINIDAGDGNDIAFGVGDTGLTLNLAKSHIEAAVGTRGDDVLVGGGRSTVFIRGGEGDDIIIGGAANDVLSGEDGDDLIDGGASNDLIRGHRGQDQLLGGAGDDIMEGGQDDDRLSGGDGNDVLKGEQGDDKLDGGAGADVAEFVGSYSEYRITKVNTANGNVSYRVADLLGREGTDTLTNIEKLSFKDVTWVDPDLASPMPVKDILDKNSTGVAFNRTSVQLISKAQILGNDIDRQGDVLKITAVSDVQGGTAVITAAGDVQFTPNASYTGIMGFKYTTSDAANNVTQVTDPATGQTAAMKAAVYLRTPDLPTDPLLADQWYLSEANIIPVWKDYTGKGVSIGQFEPGGDFSVGPEILDVTHSDLKPNLDAKWFSNPDSNLPQTYSNHATLVAGVMVGARNSEGGVGVAYDAKISGHYIQGSGLDITSFNNEITNALAKFKDYDVVNNSWGAKSNFFINVTPVGLLEQGISNAITQGRDGLGTIVVMAGGNDRQTGGNTNANALTANRGVIVSGGINAKSDLGALQIGGVPFSNPGASILVSAPASNIASTSRLLETNNGSTFGSDYSTTQGTSFATPIISGIVALMLEANPDLGWRDVQQILALSAKKVDDPNTDTVWNNASNWNGGGMHTSHDYGFGEVDARAAIRLAETWQTIHVTNNERYLGNGEGSVNGGQNLGIGLPSGGSITRALNIGAGLRVEHATVSIDVTHTNWGDLTVELISPTGTVSKLIANPGTYAANSGGDVGSGQLTFALDTTHNYGENAEGYWQLRVTDRAGLGGGVLNGWRVDVYGSDFNETTQGWQQVADVAPVISATGNNVYFYTDEFGTAPGAARTTLNDTNNGNDTINAAAVSTGSTINLNSGVNSVVAGRTLTTDGNIEQAFGGDGNDSITGNASLNYLIGGRGNDSINGGAGLDYIDGGAGINTLTGGSDIDYFIIQNNPGSVNTITDFGLTTPGEKILLVGFEGVTDFSQIIVTQETTNTRLTLTNNQSVLLQNTSPSQISEQNFGFFSDHDMIARYISYIQPNRNITWGSSGVENGLLPTNLGATNFFALDGDDIIGAQTDNDVIDGGNGNDILWGDYPGFTPVPGQDWIEGGAGNDEMYGGAENDMLLGGSGNDNLYGEAGDDVLSGATGNDLLNAGDGNDLLIGGSGNDFMNGGSGNDFIMLEGDFGTINGSVYDYYGTRVGGADADTFKVSKTGGGTGGFSLFGNEYSAYNLIADFDVSQSGELIDLSELDWVHHFSDLNITTLTINGASYTRIISSNGSNELAINLKGVDASSLNAGHFKFADSTGYIYGTENDDSLSGNAGGNTINSGLGADTMTGRTGDDTYIVDNSGDVVVELLSGGYDAVESAITYSLSDNVEQLALTGAGNINGTGNASANRIVGNIGNNVLDGGTGSDQLLGGLGDDTYVVDVGTDRVSENENGGTDTVQSSVSWTLGNNLENLALLGINSANATGNALNNLLTGNSAGNVLDGAQGADSMMGGAGDDIYFVDNAADVITEINNEGIDTVYSSVNKTIEANIENLVLFGGASSGTGNALDNYIQGTDANNSLTGGLGNDTLNGGLGVDTLVGGDGDDVYVVDTTTDVITEAVTAGAGVDTVQSSVTYTLGTTSNLENLTLTGLAAINATGNTLANVITGNSGNNAINGLAGNDTMIGGLGDDTYTIDALTDVITENLNEGTDLVNVLVTTAGGTYSVEANVENATLTNTVAFNLTGNALNNVLTGNAAANTLTGGDGNDTLNGLAGNDTMIGGLGDDTYTVDVTTDVVTENLDQGTDTVNIAYNNAATTAVTLTLNTGILANIENLTVTGTGLYNLTGSAVNNILTGNASANVLDGGLGADTMVGGVGADTYVVDNIGDAVVETTVAAETDLVQSSISYSLGTNLENLTLTGTGNINGTGNALANTILGNTGNNVLDGGAGVDGLTGGAGNDTYLVDLTATNTLQDTVTEVAAGGVDTLILRGGVVAALSTITLGAEVDNLDASQTGTTLLNLTGNALANVITGNAANNVLDGLAGADSMTGGDGSDTYVLDNIGDVVTETNALAAGGTDLVSIAILAAGGGVAGGTYTLGANIENATITQTTLAYNLTGNALDNVLTGNAVANTLIGGDGNDTLNGLAGNDTMVGGLGNDSYTIDVLTDVITENLNEGTDQVSVAVATAAGTYTLGANIENATLTNAVAYNLTGNAQDNTLTGNGLANVLDGGLGADTMVGGVGADTYVVDNIGDAVVETTVAAETDLVQSSISYSLGTNLENLTLTGTGNINGTGNALANTILGNTGNNVLDGGAGVDGLTGGAGNDTYLVDLTATNTLQDTVTEVAAGGVDTLILRGGVVAALSTITLGAEVDNLDASQTGTTLLNLTGNALANVITGNAANNVLTDTVGGNDLLQGLAGVDIFNDTVGNNLFDGGNGNDTMTGGTGRDIFIGGTGNDTITTGTGYDVISFNKGDGQDIINASTGADNTISLGGNFAYSDLSLTKSTNDLILKMGASDQITLKDWYLTTPTNKSVINLQVVAEAIQSFTLGGADQLRNNKIENFNFTSLVAAFDTAGATANWQLTDATLTTHLLAGSDSAAIGGDLAYQYGKNSNLTGMGSLNAQNVIASANFGQTAQTLNNPTLWQAELVKLG